MLEQLQTLVAAQNVRDAAGIEYYAQPGVEAFNLSMLASTPYRDQAQYFGRDHDFYIVGLHGTQTGTYQVQIILPDGRQLSTQLIDNANLIGTAQFPMPMWPAIRVPAGGRIGMNLLETSAAANTVQICFSGVRLYRVA